MRPRFVLFLGLMFVLGACSVEQEKQKDLTRNNLFQQRFELTLDRVMKGGPPVFTDELILADAIPEHNRRFTNFSGDVSGRFIGALAASSRITGNDYERLHQITSKLIPLQKPDGHFGDPLSEGKTSDNDMAMMWGNGRLLIGLMEYYQLTRSAQALNAARGMGDFLEASALRFNSDEVKEAFNKGKFAVGYICWTQHIEGLVELYRATSEKKYLDLAIDISKGIERQPLQHSHGFLSSLRGVLELYRETGEKSFLDQVEAEWKGIIETDNRLVHGAIPEKLDDQLHRDEGCSEADWLRLNLELWRTTQKIRYLDEAELILFNEFCFNQFATGDFGASVFRPYRHSEFGEKTYATGIGQPSGRAWWCCTFHGLRAFPVIFENVFRIVDRSVSLDYPVETTFESQGLRARGISYLATKGRFKVIFEIVPEDLQSFQVRIPEWASEVVISGNGADIEFSDFNGFALLNQKIESGMTIDIDYKMKTQTIPKDNKFAIKFGPWILGIDEATSPFFFDEPYPGNRLKMNPDEPVYDLDPSKERVESSKRFMIPIAHFTVRFAPGGYPLQTQTAFLHPLAERTSFQLNTDWEFLFRVEE